MGIILEEVKELRKSFCIWLYIFLGLAFFFFFFNLEKTNLWGIEIYLPKATPYSLAAVFFNKIKTDLLPTGVQLIVTNPMSGFLSQATIALMMSFILTLPLLLYRAAGYVFPALYQSEKKAILKIMVPSFLLFISGVLFAYFVLIPPTFKLLYPYAIAIGAFTFFSVSEFLSVVFGFMLACGILFLTPVFMVSLNYSGIIEAGFWKKNWQYALLTFMIMSAIITPDSSGITMILLSLPLMTLYVLGAWLGQKITVEKQKNK